MGSIRLSPSSYLSAASLDRKGSLISWMQFATCRERPRWCFALGRRILRRLLRSCDRRSRTRVAIIRILSGSKRWSQDKKPSSFTVMRESSVAPRFTNPSESSTWRQWRAAPPWSPVPPEASKRSWLTEKPATWCHLIRIRLQVFLLNPKNLREILPLGSIGCSRIRKNAGASGMQDDDASRKPSAGPQLRNRPFACTNSWSGNRRRAYQLSANSLAANGSQCWSQLGHTDRHYRFTGSRLAPSFRMPSDRPWPAVPRP